MKIEIKSCQECKELRTERVYTGDSFEYAEEWKCNLAKKTICGYQGVFDKDPEIPNWCPKKVE